MIKAGIIGATGYAGNEIVRLLLGHKDVEIKWFGSRSYIDQQYADIYQNFFRLVDAKCMDDNMAALADEVDVIFTATPQGLCASLINEEILSKCKVIDLSADFRIKDVKKYEKWYGIEHKAPQFIEEAVYGLCEINREDIKNARLIAKMCIRDRSSSSWEPRSMMCPCSRTMMQSLLRTVESLWAITKVVLPSISLSIPSCTSFSVRVSMELVASSRIRTGGSATAARAMERSCRWP